MFRRSKRVEGGGDRSAEISAPTGLSHAVHVDAAYQWSGPDAAAQFVLKEKLGEGSYGTVYRAEHRTSRTIQFAVKVLPLEGSEDQLGEVQREVDILRACRSPYIVQFYGCCRVGGDLLWVIMDYCDLGSVRDLLDALDAPFRERQIASVCAAAVAGLAYLHHAPGVAIVHRDVKGGNLLVDSRGTVKLADFGVSKQLAGSWRSTATTVGSPLWMAPEVVTKQPYTFSADIWSLGITAIEMADQWPPYADMSPIRAMLMISRNPPPTLKSPQLWSSEFRHFLEICLNKTPTKRPSATDLLRHPFITGAGPGAETLKDVIAFGLKLQKRKRQLQSALDRDQQGSRRPAAAPSAAAAQSVAAVDAGTVVRHGTAVDIQDSVVGEPSGTMVFRGSNDTSSSSSTTDSTNSAARTVVLHPTTTTTTATAATATAVTPRTSAAAAAAAPTLPPRPAVRPHVGSVMHTAALRTAVKSVFPKTPREAATVDSPLTTAAIAIAKQAETLDLKPRDLKMMAIGALVWSIMWPILKWLLF